MQDATPEQMKAGMEPWMAWAQQCGSHLVMTVHTGWVVKLPYIGQLALSSAHKALLQ